MTHLLAIFHLVQNHPIIAHWYCTLSVFSQVSANYLRMSQLFITARKLLLYIASSFRTNNGRGVGILLCGSIQRPEVSDSSIPILVTLIRAAMTLLGGVPNSAVLVLLLIPVLLALYYVNLSQPEKSPLGE